MQRPLFGVQVAIVVFDGEAPIAFARGPMTIAGDGHRTVQALVDDRLRAVEEAGWRLAIGPDEPRIDEMLSVRGLTRTSVPAAGEAVQVLLPAGPAFGGDLVDARSAIPGDLRAAAVAIVRHLGLRYAQVDFVLPADGAVGEGGGPGPWYVLDVEGSPDLQPFAELGPGPLEAVSTLLERMIVAMGKTAEPALVP